jgi:hypothetical protein
VFAIDGIDRLGRRITWSRVDSPCKDSSEQDERSRDPQLQPERSGVGGILRLDHSSLVILGRRGMDDLVEDDGGCRDEFR